MVRKNAIFSSDLDLSEVYRPEIFLNALKQKSARETKVPVDSLHIKCSFSSPSESISARLKNLTLEGCSRSGNSLCDQKGESEYEDIPNLFIYYTAQKDQDFTIPFYIDSNRSTLLSLLPMKVEGGVAKKIMAGAAVVLKN